MMREEKQIVYVLEFGDYEGSYFVSVWSTEEKAEAEKNRLNAKFPDTPNYDWTATMLDEGGEQETSGQ